MSASEETYFAELIYIGDNLMLDFEGIQGLAALNKILSAADSFSIFSGEASFELHFTFSLFDRIKTADKEEDIAEIEKQLKRYIL